MPLPRDAWSKRLLFEIRCLIRRHAEKYGDQLTIGQIVLLGTALREMGGSMADTAYLAPRIADTDSLSEADRAAMANPKLSVSLDQMISRKIGSMDEDIGEPDWSIEHLLDEAERGDAFGGDNQS